MLIEVGRSFSFVTPVLIIVQLGFSQRFGFSHLDNLEIYLGDLY